MSKKKKKQTNPHLPSLFVYKCINTFMYTFTHINVYLFMHTCTHPWAHTHTYSFVHTHVSGQVSGIEKIEQKHFN